MSDMTIRERILSVYGGVVPDKIPSAIYSRYHRVGETEREARNHGMGILSFYPAVSLLAPPWHTHAGYVSEVKNTDFTIRFSRSGGQAMEIRSFETPVGSVTQHIRKDPTFESDWIEKHYIESEEDYKIIQYIVENTVFRRQYTTIEQQLEDLGGDGIVLGRLDRSPYQKLLIELAGPERLLIDLNTTDAGTGIIEELMQVMAHRMEEQFAMVLESPVSVIWQPDNVTADMTPPYTFEKYFLDTYKERGERCRRNNKKFVVHMDGRLAALRELIGKAQIHVIDSFSFPEMSGDVAVTEALKIWPDTILCPNFPASLAEKTEDQIASFLRGVEEQFSGRPYMMQISEDIPLSSYRNLLPALSRFYE